MIAVPLTIRNAIVFHRFIPISLGAGQTLLEGIADYDPQGRFNIPSTDLGIMKQEAEDFHRPEYYGTLFNPDGVERERGRLARGFAVIRAHPFWFSGVMVRRAGSMLRLERSRLVSTEPPVSHSLAVLDTLEPIWTGTPAELSFSGVGLSPQINVSYEISTDNLILVGDNSKYGDQFSSNVVDVRKNNDYVFTAPIKIERGRMRISVINSSGKPYSSTIVETTENTKPEEQPINFIQLPFVATKERAQVLFSNEASNPPNPLIKVGPIKLFELGPARFLWTRYPRFVVHAVQKIFLTAVILPLAILGLVRLMRRKQWPALAILLVVPVYYFCVQSLVHTEYRYVLAVDYFLFALAAVSVSWAISLVIARASHLLARKS
jgi:hypothetical protein